MFTIHVESPLTLGNVTVDGAGHHVTVFGLTPFGVLPDTTSARLQNLDLVGGSIAGGAILNHGVLEVTNCTLHDSYGYYGGGAIANSPTGTLTLRDSTFTNNANGVVMVSLRPVRALERKRSLVSPGFKVNMAT